MSIYKKLHTIQKSLTALKKDKKAFNYDYVSGDKLLSMIRPQMDELGLLLLPEVMSMDTEVLTFDTWNRDLRKMVNKTEVFTKLTMRFTWIDIEDNEQLVQSWAATGQNGFDKGFGSALTYGERYYLLKLFHLQTDRDDVDAVNAQRDADMAEYERQQGAAPAPVAKPVCTPELFQKFAQAEAEGKTNKNGERAKDTWVRKYNPSNQDILAFNKAVTEILQAKMPIKI